MGYPSPATEQPDPFSSVALDIPAPGNVTTMLAAYLTGVANDPKCRNARAWKRFMRVRTDDLESVRVERAIKRVRSDLATHTSPGTGAGSIQGRLDVGISDLGRGSLGLSDEGGFPDDKERSAASSKVPSDVDLDLQHGKEETEKPTSSPITAPQNKRVSSIMTAGPQASAFSSDSGHHPQDSGSSPPTPTPANNKALAPPPPPEDVALPPSPATETNLVTPVEERKEVVGDALPTPAHSTAKIPRSKSADPDPRFKNSHHLHREVSEDGGDTSVVDESGLTTDADTPGSELKRRKTKAKKAAKKVTVDDFDMMRVLGKGCAGKVLLVKYKKTGDLYALKAITKRHVLAHQELQHTLTEQAVLKRMARENKDPFVVRLWWSFHDKDNLFLVMVCPPFPLFPCPPLLTADH